MLINQDTFEYLPEIKTNSIDLILTDPPYLISRDSNFHKVSDNAKNELKVKYGNCKIDFGDWDKQDLDLDYLMQQFYRILKPSGTLIIFFDVWKSTNIKDAADMVKFKQPRVGIWSKTNPVPINSKINYLSNAQEFFFTFVKRSKPTFNSKYDNAVYSYPICHGKERLDHPTQKPLKLFESLIEKHSNQGDVVLDPFSGVGTTAEACQNLNRKYICIEKDKRYYDISVDRINRLSVNFQ